MALKCTLRPSQWFSGCVFFVDLRQGYQKMGGATQPVNSCLFSLKNHREKIYPWRSAWCSWPTSNLLFFRVFPEAAPCWSTYSFPLPLITVSTVLGPHKHSLITAATLSSKAELEENGAWYLGINKQMMAGKQKTKPKKPRDKGRSEYRLSDYQLDPTLGL